MDNSFGVFNRYYLDKLPLYQKGQNTYYFDLLLKLFNISFPDFLTVISSQSLLNNYDFR